MSLYIQTPVYHRQKFTILSAFTFRNIKSLVLLEAKITNYLLQVAHISTIFWRLSYAPHHWC